jgi:hypothetical protein
MISYSRGLPHELAQNIKRPFLLRIVHVIQVRVRHPSPGFRGQFNAILDIQERGGEATVEVLSLIHDMSETKGEHAAPLSWYSPALTARFPQSSRRA